MCSFLLQEEPRNRCARLRRADTRTRPWRMRFEWNTQNRPKGMNRGSPDWGGTGLDCSGCGTSARARKGTAIR